jgi:hypothetical protein
MESLPPSAAITSGPPVPVRASSPFSTSASASARRAAARRSP